MESELYCARCTLLLAKETGDLGFAMHGRPPSPAVQRAIEILDAEKPKA